MTNPDNVSLAVVDFEVPLSDVLGISGAGGRLQQRPGTWLPAGLGVSR